MLKVNQPLNIKKVMAPIMITIIKSNRMSFKPLKEKGVLLFPIADDECFLLRAIFSHFFPSKSPKNS